jgi:hypothetical protein
LVQVAACPILRPEAKDVIGINHMASWFAVMSITGLAAIKTKEARSAHTELSMF